MVPWVRTDHPHKGGCDGHPCGTCPTYCRRRRQLGNWHASYCGCPARLSGEKGQRFAPFYTGQCYTMEVEVIGKYSVTLSCKEECKSLLFVTFKSGLASEITCMLIPQPASTMTECWPSTRVFTANHSTTNNKQVNA